MKRYNAVNNKWLLFGLVIPILLFFLSYNAVFAYFTATAGEKQASTQTAIVKIGFKADENGNYATHEVISSSATNNASNLVPGDTLKANATVINTGNVNVYCIINFKLSVTKKSSTDEEIIANDFYTFTSAGGQLVTPLTLKDTYTTEAACMIAPNAEVSLNVQTEFAGATYGNDYVGADVKYTYTAYAIQTSGLTPASAISEILTSLLNGGNRITKIGGNSVQNGTPTPESPVEIQSVGEKTKNLLSDEFYSDSYSLGGITYINNGDGSISVEGTSTGFVTFNLSEYKLELEEGKSYVLTNKGNSTGVNLIFAYKDENGETQYLGNNKTWNKEWSNPYLYLQVNPNSVASGTVIPFFTEYEYANSVYEPYGYKIPIEINGETTNIYLDEPLRKVGDYADYIDVQNGKVVRNVGVLYFDGSEDEQWYTWGVNNLTEGITGFYIYYGHLGVDDGSKEIKESLSNILLYNGDVWGGRSEGCDNNTSALGYLTMSVRNELLNNISSSENAIASFKTLISSIGVEFNYVLKTSTQEDIDLPEIFDEPITEYSILTTIQPDITVKYLVK